MRKFLVLFFLLAPACCATTYTANSCSQADVTTAIGLTVDGDTVVIPACSSTNWSSGITITGKGIDITGSGTPNTGGGTFGAGTSTTTLVETGTVPFFKFTGLTISNSTAKVELLNLGTTNTSQNLTPGAVAFSGTCTTTAPYCPSARADNLNFLADEFGKALDGGMIAEDNVFGVADHNSATEATSSVMFLVQVANSAWQGVGSYGDNSFASADTLGTVQAFYIENNATSGLRLVDDDVSAGSTAGGPRYVCRFNQLADLGEDGICGAHGTAWGGRFRGMRQVEVYYNTASNSSVCDGLDGILSGVGYYFSNTFTGVGCNFTVDVDIARFVMSGTPWNNCDGTQPWDQYPWSSTTQCLDQPGRGQGAAGSLFTSQNPPTLANNPTVACSVPSNICWPNPALDPIYEAGEVTPNNAKVAIATDGTSTRVLFNRDVYAQVSDVAQTSPTSPFNGTTGTGYGTLALRPTTCTPSVGYWATDQGTWNKYNSQQGTLYICTATNTWTLSFTPYTYPLPLTGGTTQASNPSCTPTSGVVPQTVTCTNPNTGTTVMCYAASPTTPVTNGLGTGCPTGTAYTMALSISSAETLNIIAGTSTATDSPVVSYIYSPPSATEPTVTSGNANSITAFSATITNNSYVCTGSCATVSAVGVCYATTANPTTPCTSNGTSSPWNSPITGLTPSTTYHFRAFATNSVGTAYGNDTTFTTSALTNCATPTVIGVYIACGTAFNALDSGGPVSVTYSPSAGNGIELFYTVCTNASCANLTTPLGTVTVSDNINNPETCFTQAPHSPYTWTNTGTPDQGYMEVLYCPSIPSGVTGFTVTTPNGANAATLGLIEWLTGSIATTGFFDSVDASSGSAGNVPRTSTALSTSSPTTKSNELITGMLVLCGGTVTQNIAGPTVGLIVNPSANPGLVIGAFATSSIGLKSIGSSWTYTGSIFDNCAQGQPAPYDTSYGVIAPLIGLVQPATNGNAVPPGWTW
jgi:hypothetical protein